MNFIFGIILSYFFFQPGINNKVATQANYYINNISIGKDLSENYWALNELFESTCSKNKTVIKIVLSSNNNFIKKYFTKVPCSLETGQNRNERLLLISKENGFHKLFIHYLLFEKDLSLRQSLIKDYQKTWLSDLDENTKEILDHIYIEQEIPLSIFNYEGSEFILFSFFRSKEFRNFFSISSLDTVIKKWLEEYSQKYPKDGLISSIQSASILSILYELDRYQEVQYILPFVLGSEFLPNSIEKTNILNASSYSLLVIGRYDESLRILREQLIPLSKYLGQNDLAERSEFTKGVNLYSLGKFEEARQIFESIYTDPNSNINKSELFNNLSICYLKLGDKNKYLGYQLDALKQAEKSTSYKERLIILRNLFIYYTSIKDINTALSYLDQAEQIAKENNDSYELAAIHSFSGTFYWEIYQDSEKALSELKIAQTEFNPNTDFTDFVNALKEEAEILVSIGSLDEAESKFNELKLLSINKSNTPNYLEALIGLTEISLLRNDIEKASKSIEEIKLYPLDDLEFKLTVKYRTVTALLTVLKGNKRSAYNQLEPVLEQVIDRARTSIDTQTGFWSIEPEYIDAFRAIIDLLISMDNQQKAIQYLDELKTINDAALYNSPILRAQTLSESDLALDQLLNKQILSLRTKYLNSSSSEKFTIKSEIDRLSAQREDILNKIREDIQVDPVSIWSVQKALSSNELVIHYTELGDKLYVSYVDREEIHIETISFDSEVKKLFNAAADLLGSSKTDLEKLFEVYQTLKLELNIPKDITSLTIIPDNYLYRLPLGILPTKEPTSANSFGSTKYLIENFEIKYYTSLNDYSNHSRRKKTNSKNEFSAFALSNFNGFEDSNLPSLPYATLEARNIQTELSNFKNKTIFLESEATKASFLKGASDSRILHVATHSEVSEQDPLFSTIYLSNNENKKIAPLYAYELFDAKMNNELIMLNSCSSGSGSFLQGSGIMGISRALRYAGANSLALNIWSVNDKSASEFAALFYSHINDGASKYEAIRLAKISLLNSGNANPYYWGAYMLIGNSSPLIEKPAKTGLFYTSLMLCTLFLTYFARERATYLR